MRELLEFYKARAKAVQLSEDIIVFDLQIGGEQYPNAWSALDASECLRDTLNKATGITEQEIASCTRLCDVLYDIFNKGYQWDNRGPGITRDMLIQATNEVVISLPQLFKGK